MESTMDINQLTKEVLVSTDTCGQFWNACVWDYKTGTNLQTFKNCATSPHGLTFLKDNYMLCAIHNKPYVIYWNLKGKTQPNKINTSSCVSCLTVSNCGQYISLGIEEKTYVLQAHSARIVSVISKHLQNISCIKFTSKDKYLITASDDTIIYVWDFKDVLNVEKEHLKPVLTWNSHSMKIYDIFVCTSSDRVISSSADQTCKFWSLINDKPFPTETIQFDSAPVRCIMDNLEANFYVGLDNGTILGLPIKSIFHESNKLIRSESDNKSFVGHTKKINCLSISVDDSCLASGSDDAVIRIWDTFSKQCIKLLQHNGPVTNLAFKNRTFFFNDEPNIIPSLFSRYTNQSANSLETYFVTNKRENKLSMDDFISADLSDNCQEEYFELKCKYENMKKTNEKIFNYAVDKIFNS